jgi:DNA-binding CsgD family transcriptional regulator
MDGAGDPTSSSLLRMPWFVGREAELRRLADVADHVRVAHPGLVLIEGEAGIGKSSLAQRFVLNLDDFTVIQASCDRSEVDIPYAVVDQLVARVPKDLLEPFALLGYDRPPGAAPFHVGVELVHLLGELGSSGPVALIVDDIQWADRASVLALGSTSRRLGADRVLVLATARSPGLSAMSVEQAAPDNQDWQRIFASRQGVEIRLDGLSTEEIATMASQLDVAIGLLTAERLRSQTLGHPLYARTVLGELKVNGTTDGDQLGVPPSLTNLVLAKVAGLPADSRELLEALVVLDARCPLTTVATLAGVADAAAAVEPLRTAGLIQGWPEDPSYPLEIRHPLHRDAIYATLTSQRRHELHHTASSLVSGPAMWMHLVAATPHADDGLAAKLELAATDATATGDFPLVATYLLWATDLSESRDERERRLLLAVAHLMVSQDFLRALALRDRVEECSPTSTRTAVIGGLDLISGLFATGRAKLSDGYADLLAQDLRDQELAMAATGLGSLYAWQGEGTLSRRFARQALSVREPQPHVKALCTALTGLAWLQTDGPRVALRELADVAELPASAVEGTPADAYAFMWRGALYLLAGDLAKATDELVGTLRLARLSTVTEAAAGTHVWLASAQYLLGDWDDAAINADHGVTIAEAEERWWLAALANAIGCLVPAGRGDWSLATTRAKASADWVRLLGPPQFAVFAAISGAALAQAKRDFQGMYHAIVPLKDLPRDEGWTRVCRPLLLPLIVEALIGTDRIIEAEYALGRLRECSQETPYLKIAVAWLTGWLAAQRGDGGKARDEYEAGAAIPAPANEVPLHRGLFAESFGTLLLDSRDRSLARRWLGQAHDTFATLGARPFRERTAELLGRVGVPAPRQPADQLHVLTRREHEIAHLVARGASNHEAASRLYISVKTVEYHLGNTYAKLGIRSRTQLAALVTPTMA